MLESFRIKLNISVKWHLVQKLFRLSRISRLSGKCPVYLESVELLWKFSENLRVSAKFHSVWKLSRLSGKFSRLSGRFSRLSQKLPVYLEHKNWSGKFSDKVKYFQPIQKRFGLSENFPDCIESCPNCLEVFFSLPEKFRDCLERFWMKLKMFNNYKIFPAIWKTFQFLWNFLSLSGKLPDKINDFQQRQILKLSSFKICPVCWEIF